MYHLVIIGAGNGLSLARREDIISTEKDVLPNSIFVKEWYLIRNTTYSIQETISLNVACEMVAILFRL